MVLLLILPPFPLRNQLMIERFSYAPETETQQVQLRRVFSHLIQNSHIAAIDIAGGRAMNASQRAIHIAKILSVQKEIWKIQKRYTTFLDRFKHHSERLSFFSFAPQGNPYSFLADAELLARNQKQREDLLYTLRHAKARILLVDHPTASGLAPIHIHTTADFPANLPSSFEKRRSMDPVERIISIDIPRIEHHVGLDGRHTYAELREHVSELLQQPGTKATYSMMNIDYDIQGLGDGETITVMRRYQTEIVNKALVGNGIDTMTNTISAWVNPEGYS